MSWPLRISAAPTIATRQEKGDFYPPVRSRVSEPVATDPTFHRNPVMGRGNGKDLLGVDARLEGQVGVGQTDVVGVGVPGGGAKC